ncbi:MAG: penicillin-binding transpeptidase domain-containing protein, partial [Solirubrobacterales bacterium]
ALVMIERELGARLAGAPGRRLVAGRAGRVLARSAPLDGREIETSLDERAQAAAERALRSAPGALVAVDPRTGGIRALVSNPEPRAPQRSPATSGYSPGSAFKLVTAAAALEAGVATPPDTVPCPAATTIGEALIRNFEDAGYGSITFEKAFAVSCNTAFARVGQAVGAEDLLGTAEDLGFRVGELEGPETIAPPSSAGELAVWSYGAAGSLASPLGMAGIAATIARGGLTVRPRFTDGHAPGERVLGEQTTTALVEMMEAVVREGTGQEAAIPGASIAGKTGTADPRRPAGRSDAWFVALAPARGTRLAVVGFLPEAGLGGGLAAALVRRFLLASTDTGE